MVVSTSEFTLRRISSTSNVVELMVGDGDKPASSWTGDVNMVFDREEEKIMKVIRWWKYCLVSYNGGENGKYFILF